MNSKISDKDRKDWENFISSNENLPNKEISLKLRLLDFEVSVGNIDNLEVKLKNLKAFYQKAKKDNMLDIYKSVNLQFDNQVVCTKK